jgi:hypothetical protein
VKATSEEEIEKFGVSDGDPSRLGPMVKETAAAVVNPSIIQVPQNRGYDQLHPNRRNRDNQLPELLRKGFALSIVGVIIWLLQTSETRIAPRSCSAYDESSREPAGSVLTSQLNPLIR